MTLEDLQAFCERSPYNAWLGVRVTAVSATGAEFEIPWRDEFVGSPVAGTVHGGVLAAVIDMAAGLGMMAVVGRPAPTIDMRVDFHRALTGGAMRARGTVLRAGNAITSAEAYVYDEVGALVASGRCVFFTAQAR